MHNLRQLDAERAQLLRAEVSWAAELLPVSELFQAELLESELLEHRMKVPDLALCWHDCWADIDLTFDQGPAKSCSCD